MDLSLEEEDNGLTEEIKKLLDSDPEDERAHETFPNPPPQPQFYYPPQPGILNPLSDQYNPAASTALQATIFNSRTEGRIPSTLDTDIDAATQCTMNLSLHKDRPERPRTDSLIRFSLTQYAQYLDETRLEEGLLPTETNTGYLIRGHAIMYFVHRHFALFGGAAREGQNDVASAIFYCRAVLMHLKSSPAKNLEDLFYGACMAEEIALYWAPSIMEYANVVSTWTQVENLAQVECRADMVWVCRAKIAFVLLASYLFQQEKRSLPAKVVVASKIDFRAADWAEKVKMENGTSAQSSMPTPPREFDERANIDPTLLQIHSLTSSILEAHGKYPGILTQPLTLGVARDFPIGRVPPFFDDAIDQSGLVPSSTLLNVVHLTHYLAVLHIEGKVEKEGNGKFIASVGGRELLGSRCTFHLRKVINRWSEMSTEMVQLYRQLCSPDENGRLMTFSSADVYAAARAYKAGNGLKLAQMNWLWKSLAVRDRTVGFAVVFFQAEFNKFKARSLLERHKNVFADAGSFITVKNQQLNVEQPGDDKQPSKEKAAGVLELERYHQLLPIICKAIKASRDVRITDLQLPRDPELDVLLARLMIDESIYRMMCLDGKADERHVDFFMKLLIMDRYTADALGELGKHYKEYVLDNALPLLQLINVNVPLAKLRELIETIRRAGRDEIEAVSTAVQSDDPDWDQDWALFMKGDIPETNKNYRKYWMSALQREMFQLPDFPRY